MIAIIKYNAGNTESVKNAINRLGYEVVITDDAATILAADKVIFPGVGEASTAMKYLKEKGLDKVILSVRQPFLGICLGLQLMCNRTEEGNTECLGIFNTTVKLFPATAIVPHMGWNNFTTSQNLLFEGIHPTEDLYFVHSYFAEICENTIATCDYILPFGAAFQNGNFYATQFHPEKSGTAGAQILKNFLDL